MKSRNVGDATESASACAYPLAKDIVVETSCCPKIILSSNHDAPDESNLPHLPKNHCSSSNTASKWRVNRA